MGDKHTQNTATCEEGSNFGTVIEQPRRTKLNIGQTSFKMRFYDKRCGNLCSSGPSYVYLKIKIMKCFYLQLTKWITKVERAQQIEGNVILRATVCPFKMEL